jgi:hypothetical protein
MPFSVSGIDGEKHEVYSPKTLSKIKSEMVSLNLKILKTGRKLSERAGNY